MSNLKTAAIAFLVLVTGLGAGIWMNHTFAAKVYPLAGGTSTFNIVEGIPYTVSQTIEPTDTTITLSSFNSPGGLPFTMQNFGSLGYATLDPNNLSRLETVSFTGITNNGSSVTLTGVTRGIDFVSPYAASSTLDRVHLVGSTLILSNPAAFYGQQFAMLNSSSTIGAVWTFASTSAPTYDLDPGAAYFTTAASSTLIDQAQLNRAILSGCANASLILQGCVQLATQLQSASSTASGSTGALLVGNNAYSTSSPGTAGIWNVWTGNDGNIAATFLDGVENYIFNGLDTFNQGFIDNASSTFTSTVNFNGTMNVNGATVSPKFGGNGANGALSISSGTTTISLGSASYFELDYTTLSITGTGNLTFSNPAAGGTFIVIKTQGNATITCTNGECIDLQGLGGAGGSAGASCYSSTSNGSAGTSGNAFYIFGSTAGGAGLGNSANGSGGAKPTAIAPVALPSASSALLKYGGQFWVGSGGGGGGCSNGGSPTSGGGGTGGAGSGSILMEVAGSLNFTGTINASGLPAGTPGTGGTDGVSLGGGGGSGGLVDVFYNTLTANTGTINVAGGTGSSNTGSSGSAGSGGGGGSPYTAGSAGSSGSAGSGGNGGSGFQAVQQNTNFY